MNRIAYPALAIVLSLVTGCPNRNQVNCSQDNECDRAGGGACLLDPVTGGQWCTYPAAECDSGRRWEEPDTDPRIAGACVILDGEVDAHEADGPPVDARADAIDSAGVTQWARAFGGSGNDPIRDIAVGADEGVVLAGAFEASVSFGGSSHASAGGSDAFVAKLSAVGDHVWSKRFGGASNDGSFGLALDAAGDVYVIGSFQGTVDFDGQALTAGSAADEFLVKLDGDTGARVWAVRLGHALSDRQDVAVSPDGEAIAVTGAFFGTINLGGTNLTAAGSADVALAKYDAAGGHVWSRGFGGAGTDRGHAVTVLANGDVAVAGTYKGPANFGGAQQLAAVGTNIAGDAFVGRYASANGAHVWVRGYGGSDASTDEFFALTADATSVYVGGHFGGSATFGGAALAANGSDDAVLAKYDATTGSHVWSKQLGGTSYETIQRLTLDGSEIWFAGYFSGQTTVGATVLDSAGIADVLYGHAAAGTGDFLGAGSVGGTGSESAAGLAVSTGNVWVAGTFDTGFAMFGATLSPVAMTDLFVGRTQR